MKSKTLLLVSVIIILAFSHRCFAQQKGVDDLVVEYGNLLHPSQEVAKNTLTYTQHYLDLKKKVAALSEENKTAFQNGISKYASDSGYTKLNAMLFSEESAAGTADTLQIKSAVKATPVTTVAIDSTVKMQVYDKHHKLVQTLQLKPLDLQTKMKSDGYSVSAYNYDLTTKTITLTLARTDASGGTGKVTLVITGDCDTKFKLQEGHSVSLHSAADGTSTFQVIQNKKFTTTTLQNPKGK